MKHLRFSQFWMVGTVFYNKLFFTINNPYLRKIILNIENFYVQSCPLQDYFNGDELEAN